MSWPPFHEQTAQGKSEPTHWKLLVSQSFVTERVLRHKHAGSGTSDSPYIVEWIPKDIQNPMNFSNTKKWLITVSMSFAVLGIEITTLAYSACVNQLHNDFRTSKELVISGISLYVFGHAFGPLVWAPLSEAYGRQYLFFGTYGISTAFNAGIAGAPNIVTVLVLRFLSGAFGSSPWSNSGGVIADMFSQSQRGFAVCVFALVPCLGTLGPMVGGFIGQSVGWRFVAGVCAVFTGILWIIIALIVPETYSPVLLKKRAAELSRQTGKVYISKMEIEKGKQSLVTRQKTALFRPWILLVREPIVLLLSMYEAIVTGILFLDLAAFPILYHDRRHWNQGMTGLAFIGIGVGMVPGVLVTYIYIRRYNRIAAERGREAPPEERLAPTMIGAVVLPIGLFVFAWTNGKNVHWIVSIIFSSPVGFGMFTLFLSIKSYLIDSYTIFAASVLAANVLLRAIFGAAFPLFTAVMYGKLGIHWASSVPAFMALACAPMPFIFYKYGPLIRARCKYSAEAAAMMELLQQDHAVASSALPNEHHASEEGLSEEKYVLGVKDRSTQE